MRFAVTCTAITYAHISCPRHAQTLLAQPVPLCAYINRCNSNTGLNSMPTKVKRTVRVTSKATPKAAPKTATPAIAAPVAAPAKPTTTERVAARNAKYLANATYATNSVSAISESYIAIFAAAAKAAADGEFSLAAFPRGASYQPERVYNYRARARLLADPASTNDQPILRHVRSDIFAFTAAVTQAEKPANARHHIVTARDIYAHAKPLAAY